MKQIVAVAIIATLILLTMMGVASAYGVKVVGVTVDGSDPADATVGYTSRTYFHVIFGVTSGKFPNQVSGFTAARLTISVNNRSETYNPYPPQLRNIDNNMTYPIPTAHGEEIKTGEYEVIFEPVIFFNDFGIKVAGIEDVKYNISFDYKLGYVGKKGWKQGKGPAVGPPPPKIIEGVPPKKDLYYLNDLEIEFIVKDVMGDMGTAKLKAYKPPHYSEIEFEEIAERKNIGGNMYRYTWKIEPEDHKFTRTQAINKTTFKLCVDYDSYYDYQNWCCGWLRVTEYIPEIVAYLGSYSKEEERQKLSEEYWNKIYIERKDLDRDFRFNATIKDKIEKGTAILEVCGVNDSVGCKKYTLAGPSEGIYHQYSNDSIRFDEGDSSLRIYYNRSKLPPWWPCPAKPWKVYNITIIPFEIAFKNATVYQEEGNWSDEFNYSVLVTASRDLTIALKVFDPCLETWSGAMDRTYFNTSGWKQLNWTVNGATFFSENCSGESKFYFEYEGKETKVYPGPDLGGNGSDVDQGPDNKGITNPHVDFGVPSAPSATAEAYYDIDTGATTAFDYNVTATSNSDIWFDISLRVCDPIEDVWMLKGENKLTHFSANETASLIWREIRPFESLNKSKIEEYIGKQSNYTFVYPGGKSGTIAGPKLVVAFKDLEMDPKVVSYGDDFTYSINVTACRNLSITLRYYNGTEWVPADETEPAKRYTTPHKGWESLKWNCKATDSWEKVKFEWMG